MPAAKTIVPYYQNVQINKTPISVKDKNRTLSAISFIKCKPLYFVEVTHVKAKQ